jgi:hypothetical protein
MRRYLSIICIVLTGMVMTGCCGDAFCLEERPEEGTLSIQMNDLGEKSSVPVTVFSGLEWQDGDTLWQANLSADFDTVVPTGNSFSARAVYHHNGDKVVVVDGAKVEVKERSCEDDCYKLKDGNLDLRLLTQAN